MQVRRSRILVLCRHALGDVILARPVFENLRAWRPDAWIIAAAYPAHVPLLALHPEIDQIVVIPRHPLRTPKPGEWLRLFRELRRGPIELAHDMTGTDRSALTVLLSGARQRVGFAEVDLRLRHRAFTDLTVWTEEDLRSHHSRELYLEPLAAAGVPIHSRVVRVDVKEDEQVRARERLGALFPERSAPVVLLHPGAATASKCWPVEDFAAVADELQESGNAHVLLLAGPKERDRVADVRGRMRTSAAVIEESLQVRELAALLQQSDLFLGNDSGPMHLAAAVGTRVVACFGGSSPKRWGPLGEGHTVLRPETPCPCPYRELCTPPSPYYTHCVRLLRREDVLEAVLRQLVARSLPSTAVRVAEK